MVKHFFFAWISLTFATASFAQTQLHEQAWGTLADGSDVIRYTLTNVNGARVSFIELGAAIVSLEVPDRNGKLADVVLGFDSAADYNTRNGAYFGLTVGRYASRIFGTELKVAGQTHHLLSRQLPDGSFSPEILHGGPDGFSNRIWTASKVASASGAAIRFSLVSPDGDQGFPGQMEVSVTYQWTDDYHLIVDYQATADKPTVVNLTQHSYFNLAGAGQGDILDHTLQMNADFFTYALPNNEVTGEIVSVAGTPFDFRIAKPIRQDIENDDPQMQQNRGYNQNFVLRKSTIPGELTEAAVLNDKNSGRVLTVFTTEPGLFLYTGNFIDTQRVMKGGVRYPLRAGVALETGHFPDSPNQPHFPSTTLMPGQIYSSQTVYAFSVKE